jgi:Helix-turn-helix domain
MDRGPGGIPLIGKRAFYIELMKTGISNSESCRRVGVDRKTGVRWQHSRRVKHQGRAYFYPAIGARIARKRKESGWYLSQAERVVIADTARDGTSGGTIAKLLSGRAVSTICREIARNRETPSGEYQPFSAQANMLARRPRPTYSSPRWLPLKKRDGLFGPIRNEIQHTYVRPLIRRVLLTCKGKARISAFPDSGAPKARWELGRSQGSLHILSVARRS